MILEYLIIGAGVTGITLCKKLKEKGIDNVLVLEKAPEAGGLCRSKIINGHMLDIGGGHFFNTKHEDVMDYVFQHLPRHHFNYYQRVSKIELGPDCTIDYPIESNIWQMPLDRQIEYIISVVRNGEASGKAEPKNYEEWIRWKLGDRICDDYMIPYNQKLWGVDPERMDIDWLHKIPRVAVEEILKYCLEKKQDKNKFPAHIFFYYPKEGGFQSIIDALLKDEKENIRLNEKVERLEYDGKIWHINGRYEARNVINTAPWNDLYDALGRPEELKELISKIIYNRIVISLYEAEYRHDWHWRYIPDIKNPYHREFFIHNFAEDSKSDGIYLETNIKRFHEDYLYQDKTALTHFETDAAYPIPVTGHADAIKKILDHYRPMRLFGVGRWGQHEYQNADVSMHEAIQFVESVTGE